MKITNQIAANPMQSSEPLQELKKGEIYIAEVKEKVSKDEAVVVVRGKEFHVRFEGSVPAQGEQASIQVAQSDGKVPQVKWIPGTPRKQPAEPDVSSAHKRVGGAYTQGNMEVSRLLADRGITLSTEQLLETQRYVKEAAGSVKMKLETIEALVNKRVEITFANLTAVHEALYGEPLPELIAKAAGGRGESVRTPDNRAHEALFRQLKELISREPDLRVALTRIEQAAAKADPETAAKLHRIVAEARQVRDETGNLPQRQQIIEALTRVEAGTRRSDFFPKSTKPAATESSPDLIQALAAIREEKNFEKIVTKVRELLPSLNREMRASLQQELNHALLLLQQGRESAGRLQLTQAVAQIAEKLSVFGGTSGTNEPHQQVVPQLKPVAASDIIRLMTQALEAVSQEADLQAAIPRVQELIAKQADRLPAALTALLHQAVQEARQLQVQGREREGRIILTHVLQQTIEQTGPVPEEPAILEETPPLVSHGTTADSSAVGLATKDILVTEITRRLGLAANEFKTLKREITRNLDNIIHLTRHAQINVLSYVKPILESAINILDKAILKSEMTLLTDMGTEKKLIQASSRLAEARKHLENGNNAKASQLVDEVKNELDRMNWRPSDVKVKHVMVSEHRHLKADHLQDKLMTHLSAEAEAVHGREPSARHVYEQVRALGLNHDSEAAQYVAGTGKEDSHQALQRDMKAILIKLAQGEDGMPGNRAAEQALNNITGQQLLSKLDADNHLQSMLFNLPLMLGAKTENVKVYVNSRKGGQKMDWENCSLYFLLDTRKMGQTGILVNVANRSLSLTVKNDTPGFSERMSKLADGCKERLNSIGYEVASIQFTKLNREPDEDRLSLSSIDSTRRMASGPAVGTASATAPHSRQATMKGFDFKI